MAKMVIIVDDRLWKSVVSDVFTFSSVVGMILIGWVLGSNALQWVGAILALLAILMRAAQIGEKHKRTISDARKYLDDLERVSLDD